jgi:hypothetical protein
MPKHSKRFQKFPPKKHKIPERKNRKRTHTQKKWNGMFWNVLELSLMMGYQATTQKSEYPSVWAPLSSEKIHILHPMKTAQRCSKSTLHNHYIYNGYLSIYWDTVRSHGLLAIHQHQCESMAMFTTCWQRGTFAALAFCLISFSICLKM